MRIVTRPDFDGVVCAVVFYEALEITEPVKWVEPNQMQKGVVEIFEGDVIANLPYHKKCSLWFDHHYSNITEKKFEGLFRIAPSAAGLVYEYFKKNITKDFSELIEETDKIDSADLTVDEVLHPEKYPYLLISMTIINRKQKEDETYWNHLVELLRKKNIKEILTDPVVREKCNKVIEDNKRYKDVIENNSSCLDDVVVMDLRKFEKAPNGNRFLHYSIFPDSMASIKIRYDDKEKEKIILSVGHNIFNEKCNVNVGLLLKKYNGGGHPGAGACCFHQKDAENYIPEILNVLVSNIKND